MNIDSHKHDFPQEKCAVHRLYFCGTAVFLSPSSLLSHFKAKSFSEKNSGKNGGAYYFFLVTTPQSPSPITQLHVL